MPKTSKKSPDPDQIADMASRGEDILLFYRAVRGHQAGPPGQC